MNKKNFTILLVFLACIAVFGTTLAYMNIKVEKMADYDMHVHVDDYIGINAQSDKIWFGTVPPGERAKRDLVLRGSEEDDLKVKIKAFGELKDWISVEDNHFVLPKGEKMNLTVRVYIPDNATLDKNYTGKLRTIMEKT